MIRKKLYPNNKKISKLGKKETKFDFIVKKKYYLFLKNKDNIKNSECVPR